MTPQESKRTNPKCEKFFKTRVNPVLLDSVSVISQLQGRKGGVGRRD